MENVEKYLSPLRGLVEDGLVLVGEHDVGVEGLHAQQGLAERAGALAEDLKARI